MRSKLRIILKLIVVLIIVSLIGAGVYFFIYPKFIKPWLDKRGQVVEEIKYDDGTISTKRKWVFSPYKSKEVINEEPSIDGEVVTKKIPMLVADNMYFFVPVPEGDYEWDFGRTLWMIDGTVRVRIIGSSTVEELDRIAGIDNPRVKSEEDTKVIMSPVDKEGVKTIATVIPRTSYAVVVDIYKDIPGYFDIVHTSILRGIQSQQWAKNPTYMNNVNAVKLDEIPATVSDIRPTVSFNNLSMSLDSYLFRDGSLYITGVTEKFTKVKRDYAAFFEVMSGGVLDSYYDTNRILYGTRNEYTIGVINYNSNSAIVLLGRGEEARVNILSIIRGIV